MLSFVMFVLLGADREERERERENTVSDSDSMGDNGTVGYSINSSNSYNRRSHLSSCIKERIKGEEGSWDGEPELLHRAST